MSFLVSRHGNMTVPLTVERRLDQARLYLCKAHFNVLYIKTKQLTVTRFKKIKTKIKLKIEKKKGPE